MEFFYLMSLIPIVIGTIVFIKQQEINWYEYLGASAISLITAVIFHTLAITGMTADIETFSGQISKAIHYPEWIEEYTTTETETDSDGKTTTHTETHHRTHPEHWVSESTFGAYLISGPDYEIDESFFNQVVKKFNNLTTETPYKSGFDSGDRNIYVSYNNTGYIYPITTTKYFENKIKAAPTVFSFPKVPKDIKVYEWPENKNWLESNRLLGTAVSVIDLREFDLMNTRLGPSKRVNVIMIGFGNRDSSIAHWQQAKWIGGKKNDLVLCYGGSSPTNATWSYVFGWTEQEIVKANLQSLLLSNPINTSILPLIEQEIKKNYLIKKWSKFDYIKIQPPTWSYVVFLIVLVLSQLGFWWWAYVNQFSRNPVSRGMDWMRRRYSGNYYINWR